MMKHFFILSIAMVLLGSCLRGINELKGLDINAEITKEMKRLKIPSLAACVVKEDRIVWKNAYGWAHIEKKQEAKTETLYPLMSVSKLVIATCVMQLVEKGRLDLDRDVCEYLPFRVRNPYPDFNQIAITPRMLLTHCSGIKNAPDHFKDYPYDDAPSLKEWLTILFARPDDYALWLHEKPGKAHFYSNTGSALMAYVVERISGTDYNEYCKEHIFKPLAMPRTSHRFKDIDEKDVAFPYGESYNPFSFHYTHWDYPGGWLKSSVDEFAHFLIACLNQGKYQGQRILTAASLDRMLSVESSFEGGMCLEWFRFKNPAYRTWLLLRPRDEWYGHNGGDDAGYSTHVGIQRKDRLGIIILTNRSEIGNDSVFSGGRIYKLIFMKANKYR